MTGRTWRGVALSIIGVIVLAYVPAKFIVGSNFYWNIIFARGCRILGA
ncbi:hypothetical protein ACI2OX_17175 [Bacillus sp. N9]